MTRYLKLLTVQVVVLAGSVSSAEVRATVPLSARSKRISQDGAVKLAERYFGIDMPKQPAATSLSTESQYSATGDPATPAFMIPRMTGKGTWTITLKNVYLSLPSVDSDWVAKHNPRSFSIILDAQAGKLVKIYSTPASNDTNLLPEDEMDFAGAGGCSPGESWQGLPDSVPPVTFQQALDNTPEAVDAEEIIAYCILATFHAKPGSPTIPVWSITLRGVPPIDMPGPVALRTLPLKYRNRMRTELDAITGKPIFTTNH